MAERRDRPRPGDFSREAKDAIVERQTKKTGIKGEKRTLFCALCYEPIVCDHAKGTNESEEHHIMGRAMGIAYGISLEDLAHPDNGISVHASNTEKGCHRKLDEALEHGEDYFSFVRRLNPGRRGRMIIQAMRLERRLTREGTWVPVRIR